MEIFSEHSDRSNNSFGMGHSCFSLLSWSIYSHGFQLANFFKVLEGGLKSEIVICFIKEEKTIKRRKHDYLKCWIPLFIKHFIN
jgi:hypothetical protein